MNYRIHLLIVKNIHLKIALYQKLMNFLKLRYIPLLSETEYYLKSMITVFERSE